MPVEGLFDGLEKRTWNYYEPELRTAWVSGDPSPSNLSLGNSQLFGRFLELPGGLVIAQTKIILGSTFSRGSGRAYIQRLPRPAHRWTADLANSQTADLPIGTGLAWQGSAANPSLTMPVLPTLSDPFGPININGDEDYWAHLFIPHGLAMGTGAFASNATTVTITHNLGLTPSAYDITITPTNVPGANPRDIAVQNIGPTTFDVVIGTGSTTPLTFAWKARVEPNNSVGTPQLVNHARPWLWSAGHELSCQYIYEARV
jgi:hypothetical protein